MPTVIVEELINPVYAGAMDKMDVKNPLAVVLSAMATPHSKNSVTNGCSQSAKKPIMTKKRAVKTPAISCDIFTAVVEDKIFLCFKLSIQRLHANLHKISTSGGIAPNKPF